VYGIKAAVRRLDFAPDIKDMEVTDIESGRFVFQPRLGKPVSLTDLQEAVTKAGYEIEGTWIEASGTLTEDGRLRVPETGQVFRLEGEERLRALREKADSAGRVTAAGSWKVTDGQEVILLAEPRAAEPQP
jgi:uncharacterized glyoxalase superfamily protein PhnB